jgi:hypothetical protein
MSRLKYSKPNEQGTITIYLDTGTEKVPVAEGYADKTGQGHVIIEELAAGNGILNLTRSGDRKLFEQRSRITKALAQRFGTANFAIYIPYAGSNFGDKPVPFTSEARGYAQEPPVYDAEFEARIAAQHERARIYRESQPILTDEEIEARKKERFFHPLPPSEDEPVDEEERPDERPDEL